MSTEAGDVHELSREIKQVVHFDDGLAAKAHLVAALGFQEVLLRR